MVLTGLSHEQRLKTQLLSVVDSLPAQLSFDDVCELITMVHVTASS